MFIKERKLSISRYHWIRDAIKDGKMEDLLYVKDYYLPVFSIEKPKNKTDAEWRQFHNSMGIKFKDEIQGLWLLSTLPDTLETFRTSLSNSAPDGVITMKLAKGFLNEEMRRKSPRWIHDSVATCHEATRHNILHLTTPGKRESKLYMTHPKISKSIVNAIDNDDMTELWHKRLGHMSEKGMSILSKKNVLSIVHDINLKKCSYCLARKQTRRAFKSRHSFRTKNIHDLVRSSDELGIDEEQIDEEHGADDVDAQEQPNLDEDVHPELPNIENCPNLKQYLSKSFAMKDLGPAKQILGIRIFRDKGDKKLHISQEQYIEKLLRRFNMDKAKVVSSPLTPNFKLTDKDCPSSKKNIEKMDRVPYASAVGSLMYAMVCTRPDLAHAVGVVSRFLSNPGKKHWEAVKWIFRYLRGTSKLGITFGNGKPMLVGYTDSDLAGNKDNMKSTSGYLMTFAGGAVSWQSRLQKCVALSTTEAEYVAATEACKELLWLKRFLQELGFKQQRYAVLCDNQSTIHLAKNSMFHKRTKHIDIRYHWIRDAIEDGMFELNKVHTDDNASDMLTKAVAREKLKICCSFAGMANSSS
ncbi:putative RNA-directed DNA polymerase [Tanacetum coccineum]